MVKTMSQEQKLIFCNRCKNETNHVLKGEHSRRFYEKEHGQLMFWEEVADRLWICAGCEQGTLEHCYTMDGYVDESGNQFYESTYYPKRTQQHIPQKRFMKIPKKLDKLYAETVEAYNNGLNILCAAGLRALIEGICVDKNIRGKNLENKIDGLNSILPENIVKNLHSFRFIGNEAIHELSAPNKGDLLLAIEVSQDLMNFIYELDYKASQLKTKKAEKKRPTNKE